MVGSYEDAAAVLQRIGKVNISTSSVWRRVERWGEVFRQLEEQCAEQAMALSAWANSAGAVASEPRLGAALDGAMVHLRDEGWKELKVGCIFAIEPQRVSDAQTGEAVQQGHATHLSYAAHLGGPDALGRRLWAEAHQRGWEQARVTQVLGDGAAWIWNVSDTYLLPHFQTLDWYHATQHLHAAAHCYAPDHELTATRWYNQAETLLFQGQSDQIVAQLTQRATRYPHLAAELLAHIPYFETNKRRMHYLEFREEGLPIGSGMIESGAKQFKARFTGPGMHWSRDGISRLIPIRTTILSSTFDDLWPAVYSFSKN
jgi:hypothetical protein